MVSSSAFSDSIKTELEKKRYEVEVAYDNKKALERVVNAPDDYGLILMDWTLPGDNGDIRKQKLSVPVVYLTGNNISEAAVYAFKACADDFVCKPLSLANLLGSLNVLLNGASKR